MYTDPLRWVRSVHVCSLVHVSVKRLESADRGAPACFQAPTFVSLTALFGSPPRSACALLQVIMMGAQQNGLPKEYQDKLRAIRTNMFEGPLPVMTELEQVLRRARGADCSGTVHRNQLTRLSCWDPPAEAGLTSPLAAAIDTDAQQ